MENEYVRINKFISANGDFARRKVDQLIIEGRITVNGITITEVGFKINPAKDKVYVDGELVKANTNKVYIVLNKPSNIISSVSDEKRRQTVVDIVKVRERIFPIGRLDFDTTGLLLMTNDGDFANKLMHPKFKVDKTYIAKLSKPLEEKHKASLMSGIRIEGKKTSPCVIKFTKRNDFSLVSITLHEGKNRQVKNMFEHYGYFVRSLHRSEYGEIKLGNLRPGEWRRLTEKEISSFS